MRTKLRSKVTLLFIVCAALLAFAGIALADVITPDGDLLTTGDQAGTNANPIDLGTVAPGAVLTPKVSFKLECKTSNHADQGQKVNLSFSLADSTVPGGSLTATNAVVGSGTGVPASWPDDGNNCPNPDPLPIQDTGDSTATITAPSTSGSYTYEVVYLSSLTPAGINDAQAIQGNGKTSVFYKVTVAAANAATTTTVTSDNNPSIYGSPVKFTATVTGTSSNPSGVGNVTFKDGPTTLCDAVALTGNTADCTTSSLSAAASPHSITATYNGATGFLASTSSALSQTVNKKALTVNGLSAQDKTYDGNTTAQITGTPTLVGKVGTDDVSLTGTASGTFASKNVNPVGSPQNVTVSGLSLSGTAKDNYSLTQPTLSANITARKVTVTADSGQGKVYGDSDPDPLTYKVTSGSLLTGDNFTGKLDRVAGENVGTYAIQKGTLSAGTNYDLTFVGANFTITARKITVTADSGQGKVYGDSDPDPLTYKVTSGSLLTGDSLGGSLARAAGENVGTYAIQQGTLSAPNSNYELTFGTGVNFTITTAPITIKANDASRYYDQSNPTFGYTVVSGSFKFNDDTNGGVTVNLTTTATPTSPAGTYPITVALNGTKAGNYNLSQANPKGTLTITAWTNQGFFAPVDYSNTENSVKGGSTVPLKFRVFEGTQQITNTAFVSGLKPVVTNCLTGVPIDDIEELATGGTSLRYDTTGSQFIFNWQTPKKPGTCYDVTVQMVDKSQIPIAKFLLK